MSYMSYVSPWVRVCISVSKPLHTLRNSFVCLQFFLVFANKQRRVMAQSNQTDSQRQNGKVYRVALPALCSSFYPHRDHIFIYIFISIFVVVLCIHWRWQLRRDPFSHFPRISPLQFNEHEHSVYDVTADGMAANRKRNMERHKWVLNFCEISLLCFTCFVGAQVKMVANTSRNGKLNVPTLLLGLHQAVTHVREWLIVHYVQDIHTATVTHLLALSACGRCLNSLWLCSTASALSSVVMRWNRPLPVNALHLPSSQRERYRRTNHFIFCVVFFANKWKKKQFAILFECKTNHVEKFPRRSVLLCEARGQKQIERREETKNRSELKKFSRSILDLLHFLDQKVYGMRIKAPCPHHIQRWANGTLSYRNEIRFGCDASTAQTSW